MATVIKKKKTKKSQGKSKKAVITAVIAVLIIAAGALTWYMIDAKGKTPAPVQTPSPVLTATPSDTPAPEVTDEPGVPYAAVVVGNFRSGSETVWSGWDIYAAAPDFPTEGLAVRKGLTLIAEGRDDDAYSQSRIYRYTFLGWYFAADIEDGTIVGDIPVITNASFTVPEANINDYTAVYRRDPATYKVVWDVNGNGVKDEGEREIWIPTESETRKSVLFGRPESVNESLSAPEGMVNIEKWTDGAGNVFRSFSTQITNDCVISPTWTDKYLVLFDPNGGRTTLNGVDGLYGLEPMLVDGDTKLTVKGYGIGADAEYYPEPVREGYIFVGWSTSRQTSVSGEGCGYTKSGDYYIVTDSPNDEARYLADDDGVLTLYAVWAPDVSGFWVMVWLEKADIPVSEINGTDVSAPGLKNTDNYENYASQYIPKTYSLAVNSAYGVVVTEADMAGIEDITVRGAPQNGEASDNTIIPKYAQYGWSDERKTINADGTTVINVYYVRKIYTVNFNMAWSGNDVGGGDPVDVKPAAGKVMNVPGHSAQTYSFPAKYELNVSDLWPRIDTGITIEFDGETYYHMGWNLGGRTSNSPSPYNGTYYPYGVAIFGDYEANYAETVTEQNGDTSAALNIGPWWHAGLETEQARLYYKEILPEQAEGQTVVNLSDESLLLLSDSYPEYVSHDVTANTGSYGSVSDSETHYYKLYYGHQAFKNRPVDSTAIRISGYTNTARYFAYGMKGAEVDPVSTAVTETTADMNFGYVIFLYSMESLPVVSYDSLGGTPIYDYSTGYPGYPVNKPMVYADPVKDGYIFRGWYTTTLFLDGQEFTFGESTFAQSSYTVYAKWEPVSRITVCFDIVDAYGVLIAKNEEDPGLQIVIGAGARIDYPEKGFFVYEDGEYYDAGDGDGEKSFLGWTWYISGAGGTEYALDFIFGPDGTPVYESMIAYVNIGSAEFHLIAKWDAYRIYAG